MKSSRGVTERKWFSGSRKYDFHKDYISLSFLVQVREKKKHSSNYKFCVFEITFINFMSFNKFCHSGGVASSHVIREKAGVVVSVVLWRCATAFVVVSSSRHVITIFIKQLELALQKISKRSHHFLT